MMDKSALKIERRDFEKKLVWITASCSVPIFLILLFLKEIGEASAFFFSTLAVLADMVILSELSGMILSTGDVKPSRIGLAVFLKLALLTVGIYVILSYFDEKPLGLFIGLTLPPVAAVFSVFVSARKE